MLKKSSNKNNENLLNKEHNKQYQEGKIRKLINQYHLILSMVIFSFIVLIFSFFTLLGVFIYSYINSIQFSEGVYIALIVLLGVSILSLMFSMIFLHKIKKGIDSLTFFHNMRKEIKNIKVNGNIRNIRREIKRIKVNSNISNINSSIQKK